MNRWIVLAVVTTGVVGGPWAYEGLHDMNVRRSHAVEWQVQATRLGQLRPDPVRGRQLAAELDKKRAALSIGAGLATVLKGIRACLERPGVTVATLGVQPPTGRIAKDADAPFVALPVQVTMRGPARDLFAAAEALAVAPLPVALDTLSVAETGPTTSTPVTRMDLALQVAVTRVEL